MARRCGCDVDIPEECNCLLDSSDTIGVFGDGSAEAPYVLEPTLDPDPDNLLVCGVDGLRAVLPDRVLTPPRARVTHEGEQAVPPAGLDLVFDVALYNDHGLWDPGNPTKFVASRTAAWTVGASVAWRATSGTSGGGSSAEDVSLILRVNSAVVAERTVPNETGADLPLMLNIATTIDLAAGDEVTARVDHTHSSDMMIDNLGRMSPVFWMTYAGD